MKERVVRVWRAAEATVSTKAWSKSPLRASRQKAGLAKWMDWWLSGAHHVGSLGHDKDLGGCLSDGEAARFF